MAHTHLADRLNEAKEKRAELLDVLDDLLLDEDVEEEANKIVRDVRGRPSGMTKQAIAKLRQAFSIGCTDAEACLFANISQDTYYRYCKKHEDFREECAELKEKPILAARANIVNAINNQKSVEDSWKYIERKRRDEFGQKPDQSQSIVVNIEQSNNKFLLVAQKYEEELKQQLIGE